MQSRAKLTDSQGAKPRARRDLTEIGAGRYPGGPSVRGLAGVAAGTVVMLAVWAVEAIIGGQDPLQLHLSSVAVWVVDALPIVLGLATLDTPKVLRAAESGIVPPPRPLAVTPSPAPALTQDLIPTPMASPRRAAEPVAPTPDTTPGRTAPAALARREATPPPIPRRLAGIPLHVSTEDGIPDGQGRAILVVAGSVEGRAVAVWLGGRGYRVVHVGEAASGSLAREAEQPEIVVVDGQAVGAQALLGELGRHGVPVVVLGGASLSLPRLAVRTMRPPTARRLGDALRELEMLDET